MARPWRGVSRGMWWHRWSGPERGETDVEAGAAARRVAHADLPRGEQRRSRPRWPDRGRRPNRMGARVVERSKRSKTRSRSAGGMPVPSSSTMSSTVSPNWWTANETVVAATATRWWRGSRPADRGRRRARRPAHPKRVTYRPAGVSGAPAGGPAPARGRPDRRARRVPSARRRRARARAAGRRGPGADRVGPAASARGEHHQGRLGRFGFEQGTHRRDRCAQIVARIRDEAVLACDRDLEPGKQVVERRGEPVELVAGAAGSRRECAGRGRRDRRWCAASVPPGAAPGPRRTKRAHPTDTTDDNEQSEQPDQGLVHGATFCAERAEDEGERPGCSAPASPGREARRARSR